MFAHILMSALCSHKDKIFGVPDFQFIAFEQIIWGGNDGLGDTNFYSYPAVNQTNFYGEILLY
jgi:hypothetical protein